MSNKKPNKLEAPLRITKEFFINNSEETVPQKEKKIKSTSKIS